MAHQAWYTRKQTGKFWNSDTAYGQGKRHACVCPENVPPWPPLPTDRCIQGYTNKHTQATPAYSHLTYWWDCRPTQGLPSGCVHRKAGVYTYYPGAFLSLGIGT